MKTSIILLAFAAAIFGGCSTPESVSHLQGTGEKQVYDAGFERVWSAAVSAAQMGDLEIVKVDKHDGYIATRRGVQPNTFGENVAIWVRTISPHQTQVEVVSREAGPPVLEFRNWEQRILNSITANLTTASYSGL